MFMSFMFCFTIINDCRLWCRWLSLWLPAVPPVYAGSSHWQHLSVLVFIPYEYWSSLFRLILLIYMYTGDRAVGVTTISSLVVPWVVLVTACGATGRCGVVTLTAPLCFSVHTVRILIILISINMYTGDGAVGVTTMSSLVAPRVVLVTACGATGLVDAGSSHWQLLPVLMLVSHKYTCWVFDKYTRIDILAHWPWDQMADIFNKFLHIAGCSLESKLKNVSVV